MRVPARPTARPPASSRTLPSALDGVGEHDDRDGGQQRGQHGLGGPAVEGREAMGEHPLQREGRGRSRPPRRSTRPSATGRDGRWRRPRRPRARRCRAPSRSCSTRGTCPGRWRRPRRTAAAIRRRARSRPGRPGHAGGTTPRPPGPRRPWGSSMRSGRRGRCRTSGSSPACHR